jgi:predicted RNA binding protein with dsRBD fold (UPF0201 family)
MHQVVTTQAFDTRHRAVAMQHFVYSNRNCSRRYDLLGRIAIARSARSMLIAGVRAFEVERQSNPHKQYAFIGSESFSTKIG